MSGKGVRLHALSSERNNNMNLIDEQATQWLVKLHSGAITDAQLAEFKRWLQASSQHVEAFRKAETLWRMTRYAEALISPPKTTKPANSMKAIYSTAALFLLGLLVLFSTVSPGPQQYKEVIYSTAVAQIQTFTLPDNTEVTLGADSKISVWYEDTQRNVRLIKGEALFNVIPDKQRPFITRTEDATITVLGTQFDVQRMPHHTRVTVGQGKVAVSNHKQIVNLTKGQKVTLNNDKVHDVTAFAPEHFAQWQRKRFTFTKQPLQDLISVLNRYNPIPVKIASPQLKHLKITAAFSIEQSQQLLESLSRQYQFELKESPTEISLF